jgi:threonine synthase
MAHDANRAVPDYYESGEWKPRASIATLASAMNVGNPSNMERVFALFPGIEEFRKAATVYSVDDAAIRARIRADYQRYGQVWCPHTAVAAEVYERLPAEEQRTGRWVWVSTAHPAKFREIVEPLIGREIPVPETLARLFARPTQVTEIGADLSSLRGALL